MGEIVRGYKVFNPDWSCRGLRYSCPGKFEEDVTPSVCERGMHFCKTAADCFNYYRFDPRNHVAEVAAYGVVVEAGDKCATDKIEIVREIPWAELLEIVNSGRGCTGFGNSGNYNSGDRNSGNCNSGDRNSGNCNSGNCNSGNRNSGSCNSGYSNSGDWNSGYNNSGNSNSGDYNSGNSNSGDYNSGDWNITDFSSGCFNTESPKIYLFNRPSEWTHQDWRKSRAWSLMSTLPSILIKYVDLSEMTDEEKEEHPEAKVTGGYLKEMNDSERGQIWWDGLSPKDQNAIRSIPNFDPAIFEQITGIKT